MENNNNTEKIEVKDIFKELNWDIGEINSLDELPCSEHKKGFP